MKKISLILLLCILLFSGCTQKSHTESAVYPSDKLISEQSAEENEQASNMSTYEFETQELFAKRDDNQIYGVVYIPQNKGEKCRPLSFLMALEGIIRWELGMQKLSPKKVM